MDVRKFYQSVKLCDQDQQLLRVLWTPNPDDTPEIYVSQVNNFGLKPAGPVASIALNLTADMCGEMYPEAAKAIKKCNYVDDLIYGGHDKLHTVELEHDINAIASCGSFNCKPPFAVEMM